MRSTELPDVREIARHPCLAWIHVTTIQLEGLRRTLIARHREAFEDPGESLDPSIWTARALADQIAALLQALDLYQHAVHCADSFGEDF
jgi:hypothetical protein